MKKLDLFYRLRRLFNFHFRKGDFISDNRMNSYVPDIVFEKNVVLYVVKYKPEHDAYNVIVQKYEQRLDI